MTATMLTVGSAKTGTTIGYTITQRDFVAGDSILLFQVTDDDLWYTNAIYLQAVGTGGGTLRYQPTENYKVQYAGNLVMLVSYFQHLTAQEVAVMNAATSLYMYGIRIVDPGAITYAAYKIPNLGGTPTPFNDVATWGGTYDYDLTASTSSFGLWVNSMAACTITSIDVMMKKTGSPTGTVYARVKRVSDGSVVGTIGSVAASSLTSGSGWHTFTSGSVSVSAGAYYIGIEYAGDASNYVSVCMNYNWTTNYIPGYGAHVSGGAITIYAGYTLVFRSLTGARWRNPVDKSNSATGTNAPYNTGSTGTLSQAAETVFALIGIEGTESNFGTWTSGSGYVSSDTASRGTTGGGDASNISFACAWKETSSTTALQGDMNAGAPDWGAIILAFKISGDITLTPAAVSAATSSVNPYLPIGPAPVSAGTSVVNPELQVGSDIIIVAENASTRASALVGLAYVGVVLTTSATTIRFATKYPNAKIRIGWAQLFKDTSDTINVVPSAVSAATASLISTVLYGSVTINLAIYYALAKVSVLAPQIPGTANYFAYRWDGSQWVSAPFLIYNGTWVSKPVHIWLDNEWKEVG